MNTLETDRLILREWQIKGLNDFYEYAKNPLVGPNAGWEPHSSKKVSLKILQSFIEKKEVWAIVLKENKKVIGSMGIHRDEKCDNDNSRMLGYVLSADYWGRGLATEAAKRAIKYVFEELNLELLSAYHYPQNTASKRVIEKCGFKYEGTLRNASSIYNEQVLDDVCYSIIETEYFALKVA